MILLCDGSCHPCLRGDKVALSVGRIFKMTPMMKKNYKNLLVWKIESEIDLRGCLENE